MTPPVDTQHLEPPAFTVVRDHAVAVGRVALLLDDDVIRRALEEASHAETVGPIVDPTLYRDAAGALAEQVAVIQAFRTFRAELERLASRARG